jgi:hypothetical protein
MQTHRIKPLSRVHPEDLNLNLKVHLQKCERVIFSYRSGAYELLDKIEMTAAIIDIKNSVAKGKPPFIEGFCVNNLPEGLAMRNNAGEDYIILPNKFGQKQWMRLSCKLPIYNISIIKYLDTHGDENQDIHENDTSIQVVLKRGRGRPRKHPISNKKPEEQLTPYRRFIRQVMSTTTFPPNLDSRQKLKYIASLWKNKQYDETLQALA